MSKASPHGASSKRIVRGEPILIDYTGVFNCYILDMTRMFDIGDLDHELQHAFDTALAIQEKVAAAMRPGAICAGSGVVGIEDTFVVNKDGGIRLTCLDDEMIKL